MEFVGRFVRSSPDSGRNGLSILVGGGCDPWRRYDEIAIREGLDVEKRRRSREEDPGGLDRDESDYRRSTKYHTVPFRCWKGVLEHRDQKDAGPKRNLSELYRRTRPKEQRLGREIRRNH